MRRSPAVRWVLGGSVAVGVATMFAMPSVGSLAPIAAIEAADDSSVISADPAPAGDSAPPGVRAVHGLFGVASSTPLGTVLLPTRAEEGISGAERLTAADASGTSVLPVPLSPTTTALGASVRRAYRPEQPVMLAGAMAGAVGVGAGMGMGGMGMGGGGIGGASSASPARPSVWTPPSRPSAPPVDLSSRTASPTPAAPTSTSPAPPAAAATPDATVPATPDAAPAATPPATPASTPPVTPTATPPASTTATSDAPSAPTSTGAPTSRSTASTSATSAGPAQSSSPAATSPSTAASRTTTSSGTSTPSTSSTGTPSASSAPTSGTMSVVGRSADLGPDARDIDLTASALKNGALITDQLLASQQVAFEGAAYFGTSAGAGAFNAFTALYGMPALQNGASAAPTEALTIRFARPVRAVGFNLFAVQFDESFVASGLASGPSFTVRYEDGGERRVERPVIEDPTLYRLLPASERPDPLWWVFEHGGLISSLTVHAPIFFASELGFDFDDVVGDLYLANLQVIDAVEPDVVVPEPSTLGLLGLGLLAFTALRRRR